jgi:hypothetical protein
VAPQACQRVRHVDAPGPRTARPPEGRRPGRSQKSAAATFFRTASFPELRKNVSKYKPRTTKPGPRTSEWPPSSRMRSPAAAAAMSVASLVPLSAPGGAANTAVLESAPAAASFCGGGRGCGGPGWGLVQCGAPLARGAAHPRAPTPAAAGGWGPWGSEGGSPWGLHRDLRARTSRAQPRAEGQGAAQRAPAGARPGPQAPRAPQAPAARAAPPRLPPAAPHSALWPRTRI